MYSSSHPHIQDGEAQRSFHGVKLDDWVLGALAFTIACANGPAMACVWLGLALLGRKGVERLYAYASQLKGFAIPEGVNSRAAETVILASGPVLIVFSQSSAAPALALAALFALSASLLLRLASIRSLTIHGAPLACAALIIMARSLWLGEFETLVIAAWLGMGLGVLAAARQRLDHAALNTAVLAQALQEALPSSSAVWEMDFRSRTLKNADQLSRILGRPISFDDLAADRLGAPVEERDLAADLFAPRDGATRFVFLMHEARAGDGRALRLQHRGILHADASGAPISLACITMIAEAERNRLSLAAQWQSLRAHYDLAPQPERLDEAGAALPAQELRARA